MELEEEEYEKYINVEPEKPKLSTIKSEFQEENVKSSINTFV